MKKKKTKPKFKRGDFVHIKWNDSCGDSKWRYVDEEEIKKEDNSIHYQSVGYFLGETKLIYLIAQSIGQDVDSKTVNATIAIPKVSVTSIRKL